jgi:hypothetical protein
MRHLGNNRQTVPHKYSANESKIQFFFKRNTLKRLPLKCIAPVHIKTGCAGEIEIYKRKLNGFKPERC